MHIYTQEHCKHQNAKAKRILQLYEPVPLWGREYFFADDTRDPELIDDVLKAWNEPPPVAAPSLWAPL